MQGLGQSNLNHDFYAYNASGQVWNGSAFVTFAVADYVAYRVAATKLGNANDASVDAWFTASTPNGAVRWELRERGATLADSPIVYIGPDAQETIDEVVKIPRAASALTAGAAVEETWDSVTDTIEQLVINKTIGGEA